MTVTPAYEGLTVLDMSMGVAGPGCGVLLGLNGADVIKLEPPDGDWIRVMGGGRDGLTALAIVGNLGKRSICVDARKPEGRDLVLAGAIISIALNPLMFYVSKRIYMLAKNPRLSKLFNRRDDSLAWILGIHHPCILGYLVSATRRRIRASPSSCRGLFG